MLAAPTCYADGGYTVLVGGEISVSPYQQMIQLAGLRDVHEVDLSITMHHIVDARYEITVNMSNNELINVAPEQATTPTSNYDDVHIDTTFQLTTSAVDPEGDQVYFMWNWDDGTYSDWMGPYNSGDTCMAPKQWTAGGEYNVLVRAKDEYDVNGPWSEVAAIGVQDFLCGDVTEDLDVNLTDILNMISFVYVEPIGEPALLPPMAGDVNKDGLKNLTDILNLISYVYVVPLGDPPLYCPSI